MTAETDLPINDAVPAPTKIEPGNLFLWNWRQMQVYAQACVAHATAPLQAEIEALRAESAEAAKVLRGALDARTDGEPLRVLAIRASNALYWRNERAERAEARADKLLAAAKRLTQEVGRLQQQYDERTACVIAHRGSALACSDAVRSAYSDERRRADRLAEALRNSADALERLAFAIRAPNAHTPRLVELAIAMRAAGHPGGSDNGR